MIRSVVFATMLAAIAIGGCGGASGPSLSAFKSGFAADKAQFGQLGTDLGGAITTARSKSNSTLASEFTTLSSRAAQQAAQLRKLRPPSQYKTQLAQLASDFDTIAGDLQTIAAAATTGNAAVARAASATLVQDAAKLKSVDVAITGKLGLPQTG